MEDRPSSIAQPAKIFHNHHQTPFIVKILSNHHHRLPSVYERSMHGLLTWWVTMFSWLIVSGKLAGPENGPRPGLSIDIVIESCLEGIDQSTAGPLDVISLSLSPISLRMERKFPKNQSVLNRNLNAKQRSPLLTLSFPSFRHPWLIN